MQKRGRFLNQKLIYENTIVIVALLSLSLFSSAQNTHFGLKGGLNLSTLDADQGPDYDWKAGFHLGGLAHIHIIPHFNIQPGLVYSQQGAKDKNNGDAKFKLGYLNLPVLLQYMTGTGFRLQTGPQLGIALSAKVKSGDVEYDVDDAVNDLDFSWLFGASYLSPGGLGIDARYNHGITNILEDNDVPELRNRVIQIGLFYQFMHLTNTRKRK